MSAEAAIRVAEAERAQAWRSPADTLAFRNAEEARLAPIIKASGARVD